MSKTKWWLDPRLEGEDEELWRVAEEWGFLAFLRERENQAHLLNGWEHWCREHDQPHLVHVALAPNRRSATVRVEVLDAHRLSPYAHDRLERVIASCSKNGTGSVDYKSFTCDRVKSRKVVSVLRRYAKIDKRDRQLDPKSFFDRPLEGLARCRNNALMEELLNEGQIVYLKELEAFPGHCIVFRNASTPLIGYDLDRFEMLYVYEDYHPYNLDSPAVEEE